MECVLLRRRFVVLKSFIYSSSQFVYCSPFAFFFFLGLHPRHMKIPRLSLIWSCSCWSMPQPQQQQYQILATSATYTAAHSNPRSLTHWAGPGIEPASSWILVGFATIEPQGEFLRGLFINIKPFLSTYTCHPG